MENSSSLAKLGDFYIDLRFDRNQPRPPVLLIDGRNYYRFMDFIYLPKRLHELLPEEIIEVCNIRDEYFPQVVDQALNRRIATCMADHIIDLKPQWFDAALKILDFGCGSGSSSRLLLEALGTEGVEVIGVDISEQAISKALSAGLTAYYTPVGTPLPFLDNTFHVVVALFVMQFSVDVSYLIELHRILRANGLLIFNIYKREHDVLERNLATAGFKHIQELLNCDLPVSHAIRVYSRF